MALNINRLPFPISTRALALANTVVQRRGRGINYAIGGIPFLAATSQEFPYSVQTMDMQKNQIDPQAEPGEQSMAGWWMRSQASWHQGAGAKFQEYNGHIWTSLGSFQFDTSENIDPWTKGQLTLLNSMEAVAPSTTAKCLYPQGTLSKVGGGVLCGTTGLMFRLVNVAGTITSVTLLTVGVDNVTDVVGVGDVGYGCTDTGHLLVARYGTSPSPFTKTFTSAARASDTGTVLWAKYRLWYAQGRHIYQPDVSLFAAATDGSALPAYLYRHPDEDWNYTAACDGPQSVYFAGYSASQGSSIQQVALATDGTVPTVVAGITAAIMPPGEIVQTLAVLAGEYMAIGTNRGLRIASIDAGGGITFGPLTIDLPDITATTAIAAWDRFFYVSFAHTVATSRVYRVDLSQSFPDGTFAWAPDVSWSAGVSVGDLAVDSDGRVIASTAAGTGGGPVYRQSLTPASTGFIDFGLIRFRSLEPKLFKWFTMAAEPLVGTITAVALVAGSEFPISSYSTQGKAVFPQAAIGDQMGTQTQIGLRVTLTPQGGVSPTLHSWQVKAFPAVKPQRLFTVPLKCFDRETWGNGQEDGFDGWGLARLNALQALEDSGDSVVWQDFSSAVPVGRTVRIEKTQFVQRIAPKTTNLVSGYGGILVATLRTLD